MSELIRMVEDYGPWKRGEELERLAPGEPIRRGAVDALRFAALVRAELAAPVTVEGEDGEPERWSLKTPPAEYLRRHPDGPHAALASRLIAAADDDTATHDDTAGKEA